MKQAIGLEQFHAGAQGFVGRRVDADREEHVLRQFGSWRLTVIDGSTFSTAGQD
ncbi:hypothetical protein [Nocardia sp. NPDC023988]|uniref:hypothetical protein n=1 Tax=unclassified Nocardia TaxID=2637762 RepID=UPI0033E06F50